MNAGKPSPPKAPQMRHIQQKAGPGRSQLTTSSVQPLEKLHSNHLVRQTVGKVTQQKGLVTALILVFGLALHFPRLRNSTRRFMRHNVDIMPFPPAHCHHHLPELQDSYDRCYGREQNTSEQDWESCRPGWVAWFSYFRLFKHLARPPGPFLAGGGRTIFGIVAPLKQLSRTAGRPS